jgi:chitodextrinase
VRDTYFSGSRSMAAYYNELSNGQLTVSGDVFGWYTLTVKTSTCDYNGWGSAARTAATAAGVDLSRYTNISYVFPGTRSCSWGGLANIGSPTTKSQLHSWINGYGTNLYIVTHELGHNFGSHHASTVRCSSGGVAAQLSRASGCSWDEYGDPFDVMGAWANTRLMNNFGRRQIGTLGTTDQQTVTTTGEYRLATAATDGGTPRILRVQRSSDSFFYLEYRRPYGLFDSWSSSDPAVNGVMIRLAPDSRRAQAQLIDTKPSTSTFADAPLSVGRTFHDPFRDITIIVRALSSTRATLYIQVGPDVTAPSVPSSISASVGGPTTVNLSWGPATDEIGVTKYRIVRNGLRLGAVTGRSYSDASAPQGTLRYEVSARDAAGNWGPPATIEVHLPDTIPPSAPGGVSISQSETGAEATVSWTAATDNIAVTGYRVWRDGTEVGTSSSLSFTDRGLTPGGQYHYEVAAYDAAGNVGARAGASVQMQGDAVPPVVVAPATRLRGNVQISKAAVHAAVRWSATDASGVARYQLQQSIDGGKWRGVSLPGPRVTQMKLSLAPTSSYRFRVRATDGLGNVSAWQQGPKFSIVTRRSSAKAITYGPGWQLVSATNAYSGALKYAQRTTSASLTFAGRSIAWVAPLGPKRGRAEVYIDGKRRAVVDLYAAKNSPRRVVFTTSWDASASRTLEIRLSGSGSPLRVDVDAFVFLR